MSSPTSQRPVATALPRPDSVITLKYARACQVTLSILYDPQSRELFHEHIPAIRPDSQRTDVYLLAFQRDQMLATVRSLNWPPGIIADYAGERGLVRLAAQLTILRTSASFPQLQGKDLDLNDRVSFEVCLDRCGALKLSSLLPQTIGAYFPDKVTFFGRSDPQTTYGKHTINVYVDNAGCLISDSTRFNTTQRTHYDAAWARVIELAPGGLAEPESEVLLVNFYGEIMSGSFFTPYFFRDSHWVTPAQPSAVQRATRRWAIEQKICAENHILATELLDGESCRLSSDGRGFFYGIVRRSALANGATKPGPARDIVELESESENGLKLERVITEDKDQKVEGHQRGGDDEEKEQNARSRPRPRPRAQSRTSSSESAPLSGSESASSSAEETELGSDINIEDDEKEDFVPEPRAPPKRQKLNSGRRLRRTTMQDRPDYRVKWPIFEEE